MTILSFSLPKKTSWGKNQNPKFAFSTFLIFPFLMPIQFLSQSSWFEAKKQFLNLLLPPFLNSHFGLPFSFSFYLSFLDTSYFYLWILFTNSLKLVFSQYFHSMLSPNTAYIPVTKNTVMDIFKQITPNIRYLYLTLNLFLHLDVKHIFKI